MRYDNRAGIKEGRSPTAQSSLLPKVPFCLYRTSLLILMIRLFTIFCKLNQISFSDRQWFEKETASFCVCDAVCPHCGAKGCLSGFAHYDRYLIEMQDHHPVAHEIQIQRYQCSSCGHTHALLSSGLVPYRSYSLRFILLALREYFLHSRTVEQICDHFGISASTLYRWRQLFKQQKCLWLGVLEDLAEQSVQFLEELDIKMLGEFQKAFCFSFLECPHVTDQEMPSGNEKKGDGIT